MKLRLLLMALLLSLTAVSAYATDSDSDDVNVLFYEDFNYYEYGMPSGWSINKECVRPAFSKDEQGRCAKLISREVQIDASLTKYFSNPPQEGIVYSHLKLKAENVVFRHMIAFRDSDYRECQALYFDADGYVKLGNLQKLFQYKANRWYDILIRYDLDNKKYSVWIDNKLLADNVEMNNQQIKDIYFFKFTQLERMNAACFVDDLYAYQGDVVLSGEEVKDRYFFRYNDIESSWAKAEIETFADKQILSKTEDGSFNPDENIIKKDFTIWFGKTMGLSEQVYANMCSDVTAKSEEAGYVQALVVAGACGSYEGEWHSADEMTLGTAIEMMVEGYKYEKNIIPGQPQKKFKSLFELGEWCRDYEAQADAIKLLENVKGLETAKGNSDKIITRAQAVKMLANYQMAVR